MGELEAVGRAWADDGRDVRWRTRLAARCRRAAAPRLPGRGEAARVLDQISWFDSVRRAWGLSMSQARAARLKPPRVGGQTLSTRQVYLGPYTAFCSTSVVDAGDCHDAAELPVQAEEARTAEPGNAASGARSKRQGLCVP